MEILHCIFFPDPKFDLPIFGVDVVATPKEISAAIVDLSPVVESLPRYIDEKLSNLNFSTFNKVRTLPGWASIFSSHVIFVSPQSISEINSFINLVDEYLSILISYSYMIKPDSPVSPITIDRYKGQKLYCHQQKLNDKTRNVLAKTFNPHWADQYIEMVLFDCPKYP